MTLSGRLISGNTYRTYVWCWVWNTLCPKCMCPTDGFPFMMWLSIPCSSGMHSPCSTTGSWRRIAANTSHGSQRSWEGRPVVPMNSEPHFVPYGTNFLRKSWPRMVLHIRKRSSMVSTSTARSTWLRCICMQLCCHCWSCMCFSLRPRNPVFTSCMMSRCDCWSHSWRSSSSPSVFQHWACSQGIFQGWLPCRLGYIPGPCNSQSIDGMQARLRQGLLKESQTSLCWHRQVPAEENACVQCYAEIHFSCWSCSQRSQPDPEIYAETPRAGSECTKGGPIGCLWTGGPQLPGGKQVAPICRGTVSGWMVGPSSRHQQLQPPYLCVLGTFSVMSQVLDPQSARLNITSLRATQTVKYELKAHGNNSVQCLSRKRPAVDPVCPHLSVNMCSSHAAYKAETEALQAAKEKRQQQFAVKVAEVLAKKQSKRIASGQESQAAAPKKLKRLQKSVRKF